MSLMREICFPLLLSFISTIDGQNIHVHPDIEQGFYSSYQVRICMTLSLTPLLVSNNCPLIFYPNTFYVQSILNISKPQNCIYFEVIHTTQKIKICIVKQKKNLFTLKNSNILKEETKGRLTN